MINKNSNNMNCGKNFSSAIPTLKSNDGGKESQKSFIIRISFHSHWM